MSAVLQAIAQHAAATPERVAIDSPTRPLGYGALWHELMACCDVLAAHKARVVGLAASAPADWIVWHLACVHSGVAQVPLPPFFTEAQRTHALRDAGANLLVGDNGLTPLPYAPVALPPETAIVTYTSGSTGTPKGVCLGQHGMERVAHALLAMLGAETAARHLHVLPLAVLLEQVAGLYPVLLAGGSYVVAPLTQGIAPALAASAATSCILVPELLKGLLQQCAAGNYRFEALKFAAVGGAKVAQQLLQQAQALGLPVYEGYGLTESASVVAVNMPGHTREGTVGKVLPHVRCRIAADGEIILADPALLGYTGGTAWQGEYATGDLGTIDADGYLHLAGRKKNLLITAQGRNIAPEWPESLLTAEPAIAQACVYGDGAAALSALIVPATAGADVAGAVARVNAQLPEYARIGSIRCCAPFTPQNGLLTGNGRLKREAILEWLTHHEAPNDLLRPACA